MNLVRTKNSNLKRLFSKTCHNFNIEHKKSGDDLFKMAEETFNKIEKPSLKDIESMVSIKDKKTVPMVVHMLGSMIGAFIGYRLANMG